MRSLRSGVSLAELLAVVVMVGILAGIALPSYQNMVERARVRDAQTTLNMIFQAQRIFRLDQTPQTYGDLPTLIARNYLPNPNGSADWTYTAATVPGAPPTFTATATRNGGGAPYAGTGISLDQTFTGGPIPGPPYNGKTYADPLLPQQPHPLKD